MSRTDDVDNEDGGRINPAEKKYHRKRMFFKAFNTYISYLRNSNLNTSYSFGLFLVHTPADWNILRCDDSETNSERKSSSILNGIVHIRRLSAPKNRKKRSVEFSRKLIIKNAFWTTQDISRKIYNKSVCLELV